MATKFFDKTVAKTTGQVPGIATAARDVTERNLAEVKQRVGGGQAEYETRPIAV